jgi:glucuronate isomerase
VRTAGVAERYCTGNALDREKFQNWAETVPQTLRNPLYQGTRPGIRQSWAAALCRADKSEGRVPLGAKRAAGRMPSKRASWIERKPVP